MLQSGPGILVVVEEHQWKVDVVGVVVADGKWLFVPGQWVAGLWMISKFYLEEDHHRHSQRNRKNVAGDRHWNRKVSNLQSGIAAVWID